MSQFIGGIADQEPVQTRRPIIRIENASRYYGGGGAQVNALNDFSLDIYARDFIVVCGPSGCGKSTLLNIITGLEEPSLGRAIVRGENMLDMDEDGRGVYRSRKMGVVYQRPYWIRSLNCLQNVALPLILEGATERVATRKASELLDKYHLAGLERQDPSNLSGGEQQKLAFARALVTNPGIIIADEPTGNLDTTASDEMMSLFHDMHIGERKTVIIVTHNQAYWNLGNRRIEMKDGRLIKDIAHA